MLLVFTFAFDTQTKEAAIGGNVEAQVAMKILQDIVIAQAVSKAKELKEPEKEEGG